MHKYAYSMHICQTRSGGKSPILRFRSKASTMQACRVSRQEILELSPTGKRSYNQ
jgi:hypothetical protein